MQSPFLLLLIFFAVPSLLFSDKAVGANESLDSLLVYGEGFKFTVREPTGWIGDTENASKFSANIIFYPEVQKLDVNRTVIRVLIASKVDENTHEDLAYDMESYKERYAEIEFQYLAVEHSSYKTYSKLFMIPTEFYEYVSYINPGADKKYMFSASMNKQKKSASKNEIEAYNKIILSITAL